MATGANTTPLGRLNSFPPARPAAGTGVSLLKPSYMAGALPPVATQPNGTTGAVSAPAPPVALPVFPALPTSTKADKDHDERDRDRDRDRDGRRDRDKERSRDRAAMTGAPPVVSMLPSWASQDENSNTSMGSMGSMGSLETSTGERRRKRRSRWCCDEKEKVFIPGMPTVLPTNLDPNQERAYLLQLQIEELSRRLRTEDLGIPFNPEDRSPSPEPIYNSAGKRLNTREYRVRKKLEDERHVLIQEMFTINPEYKPPSDYKPPLVRVSEKVMIPQEEHPDINFVGLLIGPRGNTLKSLEKETGAKIIIRGKGSVKEGKVGRKDGQPLPGEDEPLHAFVTASSQENVRKAVDRIKEIIRQGVEVPEGQNDLRRMQLRELALLNGTLRENDLLGGPRCSNCGAPGHKAWQCPDRPNITNNVICACCGGTGGSQSKIDEEYMSLMAELGEGPPTTKQEWRG
ncbi:hypothetical protein MTO96_016510 [Rhipicephalus appendiculatus]